MRNRLIFLAVGALPVTLAAAASPREKLAVVAQGAQALGSEAAHAALDEAAAYWFDPDRRGDRSLTGRGPALAAAIRLARAEALRSGARPIPHEFKQAFRAYYSDQVLNSARWIVAPPDSRLGRLLARWPVKDGAVTLGEVIVFKTRAAAGSRRLFAHELAHVDQYSRLGIDQFAERYAANRASFEDEARAKAREVVKG